MQAAQGQPPQTLRTTQALVAMCAEDQEWGRVAELWEVLRGAAEALELRTYHHLLRAAARTGQWELAEEVCCAVTPVRLSGDVKRHEATARCNIKKKFLFLLGFRT